LTRGDHWRSTGLGQARRLASPAESSRWRGRLWPPTRVVA
jgi:hypothetical protein